MNGGIFKNRLHFHHDRIDSITKLKTEDPLILSDLW